MGGIIAPVTVSNEHGAAPLVLVCEHASNLIPAEFGTLGLGHEELAGHVAWDPGAAWVSESLSRQLDAPLIAAGVSRLVIDCNRPPEHPGAMPELSERTAIPGNRGLSPADRAARVAAFYDPFHAAIERVLDARAASGERPGLVTIHSFTPVFLGQPRAVELGIVHDADTRLADGLIDLAVAAGGLAVRRNEPYGPADGVTHTLKRHGLARGLPNAMIEIRNDLLADDGLAGGAAGRMADRLAALLTAALARLGFALGPDARSGGAGG